MTNKEAILSKYWMYDYDGLAVVSKLDALKAMDEYAASSPSLREALEGLLKIIDDSYGVFDHYEEGGAKDTGVTKWAVFKEEIQAARTALAGEGDGWVRVEDGLPKDSDDRQVWEKGSLVPSVAHYLSKHYFMDNYNDSNYMDEGWYYSHGYLFDDLLPEVPLNVTHYRPLPTPPTNQVK